VLAKGREAMENSCSADDSRVERHSVGLEMDLNRRSRLVIVDNETCAAWVRSWCELHGCSCQLLEFDARRWSLQEFCRRTDLKTQIEIAVVRADRLGTGGPGGSGANETRPRILAIANNSFDAGQLLCSGVDDVIREPFVSDELHARLSKLMQRAAERRSLKCGPIAMDPCSFQVHVKQETVTFTKIQHAILLHLIAHQDRVVSIQELQKAVLGTAGDGGAIRYHICILRKSLARDDADVIHTVRGFGYRALAQPRRL
jgi:DNA-binding winged helix-turn-helix (wHTH) protein